ncbi:unnamed protein product [Symbiodinium sp. KB8]|nr:unnamed protein product [Symbiodinium sp. KB8]
MGCGASSRTNTPVSNPKAPLHPDADDSDGSEYGEHHEPMPAEDVQGVKDMPVTAAQDLSANTRQGYKWHAQIVGDNFFHKKHCTAPGFLKACRPFPHIKISDLRASLDKNEHGSWILSGPLNDWPGLVGLEFVSITCKVRSVMGTAVRRLWLHGSAEDTGPMEVLQALSDKTLRSLRGTFRAPTWTSVGWSPSSPGFLLWHASGYGGGLLHGSATVDFARSNKEAAEATATNVHFFTHRYAKATEGIKDRLIWHGAILIEWSHQRFVSVVELAWLNGLGGYHGRCNWCRDKLADPTAIYAGMPDSMKVPWQQHLAEIRMVDTEMKSFQVRYGAFPDVHLDWLLASAACDADFCRFVRLLCVAVTLREGLVGRSFIYVGKMTRLMATLMAGMRLVLIPLFAMVVVWYSDDEDGKVDDGDLCCCCWPFSALGHAMAMDSRELGTLSLQVFGVHVDEARWLIAQSKVHIQSETGHLQGQKQESRWVLPITGRQKLSTAFEVDDDAAGRIYIKEAYYSALLEEVDAPSMCRRALLLHLHLMPRAKPVAPRAPVRPKRSRKRSRTPPSLPRMCRPMARRADFSATCGLTSLRRVLPRKPWESAISSASPHRVEQLLVLLGSIGGLWEKKSEKRKRHSSNVKYLDADANRDVAVESVFLSFEDLGAAGASLQRQRKVRALKQLFPVIRVSICGVLVKHGQRTWVEAADAAMPSPEARPREEPNSCYCDLKRSIGQAEAGDAPRFAFLPELSLSQALKERADSFLAMQTEVREFLTTGRPDVKAANDRVRKLRKNAKWLDTFKDKSSFAWTQAMNAEEPMQVKQAMGAATRIMQELSAAFAEVEVASGFVKDLFQMSEGRLQRAESCNKLAPHIWANAVRATRLMHEKLTMQWRMAAAILKHADASKRVSYKKADETVRLVNEKLLRWKEEAEILQQEAREDEMARQAALRMGAPRPSPVEVERQHADMARQRQELERQRMQAIQWGRHLVQPIPQMQFLPPKKAAAKAYAVREESARSATPSEEWSRVPPPSTSASEVPPPPGDQPAWAPQPPGPPP